MNRTHKALSNIWDRFQTCLFPWLEEKIGPLNRRKIYPTLETP